MYNRLIKPVFAIACMALVLSMGSCSSASVEDEFPQFFIAEVEVLEAPDSVDSSEVLSIRIAGVLGHNLCYQLDRIETIRRPNQLDVIVHGRLEGGACFDAFSLFDELILIAPPLWSDFTIVVHQPDGSALVHTVAVNED